ncbi:hypothetical protein L7F22_061179 [Adiantum nelumboides]|nr:hypothetical protein [Adiantum nelumboides]
MLSSLKEYKHEQCNRVLQSSPVSPLSFQPFDHGFVRAVGRAYSRHHNLIIRPDDVWLAILVQFGLNANANAEAFRSRFVAHQGKKELTVSQIGSLGSVDYARFVLDMVSQLRVNITDLSFCDWVLPCFSTTTHDDTIVASVALMATMKKYFDYKCYLDCGIPQVSLAGTVQDWEEIDRGPSFLSGWITAFCMFDGEGNWQATNFTIPRSTFSRHSSEPQNLEFPVIETSDIPPGYITVDVTVDDNGTEHKTLMFAGRLGYDIVQEGKGIAPKLAWGIALKGSEKKQS